MARFFEDQFRQIGEGEGKGLQTSVAVGQVRHINAKQLPVFEGVQHLFTFRVRRRRAKLLAEIARQLIPVSDNWAWLLEDRQQGVKMAPQKIFPQKIACPEQAGQKVQGGFFAQKGGHAACSRIGEELVEHSIKVSEGLGRVRCGWQIVGELLD